jgi:hypothetical protein
VADIKDIQVRSVQFAPSGAAVETTTRTVYELFKAKSFKTVQRFNMGIIHRKAASSSSEVVDFTTI